MGHVSTVVLKDNPKERLEFFLTVLLENELRAMLLQSATFALDSTESHTLYYMYKYHYVRYLCECVIGWRCVWLSEWWLSVSVGCRSEVIGSSLRARSLKAGSSQLPWAFLSLNVQPDYQLVCVLEIFLHKTYKILCSWWCSGEGKRFSCCARVSTRPWLKKDLEVMRWMAQSKKHMTVKTWGGMLIDV